MSEHTQSVDTSSVSANEIYQKMEHKKHIFEKPDTYVGSCEGENQNTYIHQTDNDSNFIKIKNVNYAPGWYKCFDELLVNAHDHKKRIDKQIKDNKNKKCIHEPVTVIKVSILEDNSIEIYNDGDGIHIEYLDKYDMYPVELIFYTLLSSTNFDDNDNREWGGRNGYGAKLANIFGKRFSVETVDHINKKKLVQVFSNNMQEKTDPIITTIKREKISPYTKITWLPDYERFGMDGLNDDIISIIRKRTYDIAGVTDKSVKVYFNNKLLDIKDFEKYVDMYIGSKEENKRAFDTVNGWDVIATSSSDEIFEHVSFVNGIYTSRGGTHVEYVADQIKTKLADFLKKKKKLDVKPQIIKNQLKLFVNAYKIVNPNFDSQTKETLKTVKSKFGTTFEISQKFIENLAKTDIVKKIEDQAAYKDSISLSKTDGKKNKRVKIPKLLDASAAGTKESIKCSIIFTEGDSAKSMAVAGLSEVGREYYGVYPLRGKIQNIRGLPNKRILECDIINKIKSIIGLQSNVNYKKKYEKDNIWPLRYGKIILMTDQDHDGTHIKGLVMNIFDVLWPELLELGFITCMITPIVKAFKANKEKAFFTLQDYYKWKKNDYKGWKIKYYKGLGTSSSKEAKEYFKKLNIISYISDNVDEIKNSLLPNNSTIISSEIPVNNISLQDEITNESKNDDSTLLTGNKIINEKLDLAFNSKRACDRKFWLGNYEKDKIPDYNNKKIYFNDFVDDELIHYSNADNERSIPSVMDGLKPSTRKVLFASFKRKLTQEVKVAQLSGYTSEHSAYHHGEVSLESTIKGMAQDYVGSNNINYLLGIGQFGTRLQGGKDAAQSRYIFTKLNPLTRSLFKESDDSICTYLDDDGQMIEPEYYYPILPAIAINGSQGIGTGYSTKIPSYNPLDIVKYIKNKINKLDNLPLKPWYKGFKGKIESISKNNFITRGKYTVLNDSQVKINELPIGVWTEDYIELLEKLSIDRGNENTKNFIKSYVDESTEDNVNITVKLNPKTLLKWQNTISIDGLPTIENKLKLTSTISTSNMYIFDENCKIRKFDSIESLIDYWYEIRKGIYVKRRAYILSKLLKELNIMKYKVQFILEIINSKRIINNKKKADIILELENSNYLKIAENDKDPSFDYLLNMNLYKLTYEEVELLKQKLETKQAEYDTINSKSETDLWINDLDSFIIEWKSNLLKYNKEHKILNK
tara:strand:- start:35 stop:3640 length:3606 start_codon:yes stop_codon:yes gene_type:complete